MTKHASNTDNLVEVFQNRYSKLPSLFYAPGRINLIGEHTDYNEGFVMPFAIDRGTTVAAVSREDQEILVLSLDLQASAQISLESRENQGSRIWKDYIEGTARSLIRRGIPIGGANLMISSTVEMGAGLASSAALEIAVSIALCKVAHLQPDPLDVVRSAVDAENQFIGIQSGIMDQFVAMFAEEGCCLFLDCRSLASRPVPISIQDNALIVCDTGVKHQLALTEYNRRYAECREGLRQIQQVLPDAKSLRDVSCEDFHRLEHRISQPERNRCRHVITENQRTRHAVEALENFDYRKLGELMFQSHASLRNDYEVSSPELDALVEAAAEIDGVLGARMTGGGFGGCTINVVRRDSIEEFEKRTTAVFHASFTATPKIFEVKPSSGALEVENRKSARSLRPRL